MPEPSHRRIADTLQRNVDYIATCAAESLGTLAPEQWGRAAQEVAREPIPSGRHRAGLGGEVTIPPTQDEAAMMIVDGFRRLGKVVAVSVLVDEPGLIADDLTWLEHMFGSLGLTRMDSTFVQHLARTYVSACGNVLSGDDLLAVETLVERALEMRDSAAPDA